MTNTKVNIRADSYISHGASREAARSHARSGIAGKCQTDTARIRTAETASEHTEKSAAEPRRKRTVSRTPDMSEPQARVKTPGMTLRPSIQSAAAPEKAKEKAVLAVREERKEKEQLTVRTVADKRSNPFPFSAILTTLFCTLLFMYMIYNYVGINEYSIRVKTLKKEISTLTVQQKELDLSLSKRDDLTVIAQRAEELGMVKLDEVQKFYINGKNPEKMEVSETARRPGEVTGNLITDIMSALGQNFRQIAEYIR